MTLHQIRNRPRLASRSVSGVLEAWLDVLKAWRRSGFSLWLSLAVLVMLSISRAFFSASAHRIVDPPKAITDIAISTNEADKSSTIFVADERSGVIYSFTPQSAPAALAQLELSKFV